MRKILKSLGTLVFRKIGKDRDRKGSGGLAAGLLLAIISMVGMELTCRMGEKEMRRYRELAGALKGPDAFIPVWKEQKEQLAKKLEAAPASAAPCYEWDALYGMNRDIAGWLWLPEGCIDLPVVQGADNEFYLTHDFMGEENRAGCLFLDKDARAEDFNHVIYGHNMGFGSQSMFSALLNYGREDFFKENRVMYYTETYKSPAAYEVMAVVKYDIGEADAWDFRIREPGESEAYAAWMEGLKERAVLYHEPEKAPARLLTLATCDRREHGQDGRFLVIAAAME